MNKEMCCNKCKIQLTKGYAYIKTNKNKYIRLCIKCYEKIKI